MRRQIFIADYDELDADRRDEESDGPIELTTTDGLVHHISANTEKMAVEFCDGPMPQFGSSFFTVDVSHNKFWTSRLDTSIIAIDVLQSLYTPPVEPLGFGFQLFLENNSVVIEYISDETHIDQLRITDGYQGTPCRRKAVE